MIPFARKSGAIARLLQSLLIQTHKPFHLIPRSVQTLAQDTKNSDLILPICNLLSRGANWDNLTASFHSLQLSDPLIEKVLLNLKEPIHAKKALTFFHWSSQDRKFQPGIRPYCLLIHILVRAGLLTSACALIQSSIKKYSRTGDSSNFSLLETFVGTYELTLPGPRVFDLLVQTYSKMRMVEQAFDACRYLIDHGFYLNLISFNSILNVAQKSGKNDLAWKVYEFMFEKRVFPNHKSVEIMIEVMCKEGTLTRILSVLDRIHDKRCTAPGVIVNSKLAFRIFERNRIEDGIALLMRMLQKNLILDGVMNSLVLFGYCKLGRLESAYEIYDDMVNRGLGSNAFVYTAFIGAYCKEGKIDEAIRLMEEMVSIGLKPYDEAYNFLIEGCSRLGRLEDSLGFYENMIKDGFLPDNSACNEMIGRICETGEAEKANEILTTLIDKGFVPNEETYSKLMDGFGKIGKSQEIVKLYYEVEHKGIGSGLMVCTSLIRNLCLCGKLNEAEKFLKELEGKSSVLTGSMYDSMIRGYCKKGDMERALYFYDEMVRRKFEPCAQAFMKLVRSMTNLKTTEFDSNVM